MTTRNKAFPAPFVSETIEDSAAHSQRGLVEGLIIEGSRGQYQVETAGGTLRCTIRGRLRKQFDYTRGADGRKSVGKVKVRAGDPVKVGDHVRVLPTGGGGGVIEDVIENAGGSLTRGDSDPGKRRTTSVAGIDQMIAVFAAREPDPHLGLLDRFLVLAEAQELPIVIAMNKADLGIPAWLGKRIEVYRAIGYPVIIASATTGQGVDELRACLGGRTSALLGPSGVGKSSLLNALEPGLALRVSAISDSTGKGRHTTTGTRMVMLNGPDGGYLADTAGIRALSLHGAAAGRLDWCFREFRPFLGTCRLSDCRHTHEPGCAVRVMVEANVIDAGRYRSYCRLLAGGNDEAIEDWGEDGE